MSKIYYYQICDDCKYEELYPCNKEVEFKHKDKCDQCGSREIFIVEELA